LKKLLIFASLVFALMVITRVFIINDKPPFPLELDSTEITKPIKTRTASPRLVKSHLKSVQRIQTPTKLTVMIDLSS